MHVLEYLLIPQARKYNYFETKYEPDISIIERPITNVSVCLQIHFDKITFSSSKKKK